MRKSAAVWAAPVGVLFLLVGSQGWAADRKIEGTVKGVDASKSTITLTTGKEGSTKDETLDVLKKAKITSNGQPATLTDIRRGQKGVATFNQDLEVVTALEATGEATATLVPELVQITELPGGPDQMHTGPWLSPDGLTLFWKDQGGISEKGWIWSARRETKDGLFDNVKKHVNGGDLTVTTDGLEMILLTPEGLHSTTRASLTAAFNRPTKIAELQGHGFLSVPCFGGDDLTLYVDKANGKQPATQVKFTRASRTAKWTGPTPVKIDLPPGKLIRHFSVASDGKLAFGLLYENIEGKAFWEAPNQFAMMRAEGEGFGRPIPLWLGGKPLNGTFPRYVSATNEFFLTRAAEGQKPQIWVIRNFDPNAVEADSGEQAAAAKADAADDEKQLQGRWVAVSEEINGNPLSADQVKKMKKQLEVKGKQFTLERVGLGGNHGVYTGTVRLHGVNPRLFDWIGKATDGKGQSWEGVYELTDDTFRVCYVITEPGVTRPTSVRSSQSNKGVSTTFKREGR